MSLGDQNLCKRWRITRTLLAVVSIFVCGLFIGSFKDGDTIEGGARVYAPIQNNVPTRLIIDRISLDAAITLVGLTSAGAMDVPQDVDDVGWLYTSQRPGDVGTSVVTGHYGLRAGRPSVFDDLHKLRRGDRISVQSEDGALKIFVVRFLRRYAAEDEAPLVFGSHDGVAHLNLITCEGAWDAHTGTYPIRLVIFAELAAALE